MTPSAPCERSLDLVRNQRDPHPATALFPMLPDDELADLAADIKANGLLQSIVLDDQGRILDGRNRLKACEIAGVDPRFETYEGDDPVTYAISVNLARRHLTKGQRAMVAAKALSGNHSQRQVASVAGMSQDRIKRAVVILDHAPDLADLVIAGTTSLDAAYEEARENKRLAEMPEGERDLVIKGQRLVRDSIDTWTRQARLYHTVVIKGHEHQCPKCKRTLYDIDPEWFDGLTDEEKAELPSPKRTNETEEAWWIRAEDFADDIGEEPRRIKALAEAWEQRDHFTDKGWAAKLREIDNARFEDADALEGNGNSKEPDPNSPEGQVLAAIRKAGDKGMTAEEIEKALPGLFGKTGL